MSIQLKIQQPNKFVVIFIKAILFLLSLFLFWVSYNVLSQGQCFSLLGLNSTPDKFCLALGPSVTGIISLIGGVFLLYIANKLESNKTL